MNFAKKMAGKAGETIGKGVKVVQDKAEEGQWKEKASAAASSAGSKAKALYEDKTGRNAKVDGTVAKAGLTVAAGVAAASMAANAAVVGAAVAGVATAGAVAAEKAGYGKQVQQVKDGVAKSVSGAKELAAEFTGGYKKGKVRTCGRRAGRGGGLTKKNRRTTTRRRPPASTAAWAPPTSPTAGRPAPTPRARPTTSTTRRRRPPGSTPRASRSPAPRREGGHGGHISSPLISDPGPRLAGNVATPIPACGEMSSYLHHNH